MAMVALPAPEIDPGLKPTVTPEGCPEADRAIVELNPPLTVLVMVEFPEPPCAKDSEEGEALSEKLPDDPVTESVSVVVATRLPEVPVMVTIYVPELVPDGMLTLKFDVREPEMRVRLRLTEGPLGETEALKLIGELYPP